MLSQLFEQVYSVERIADFCHGARETICARLDIENVHISRSSTAATAGASSRRYRAIVVTAGTPEVPAPLFEQLDRGRTSW